MTTRRPGGGRKRTPTALKLLTGNPGKRPLNEDEPRPAPRLPVAPTHLGDAAKKEWRRAGRFLLQLGLMSDLDRTAFAAYCTAYGRWIECEEALKTYGVMLKVAQWLPHPVALPRGRQQSAGTDAVAAVRVRYVAS